MIRVYVVCSREWEATSGYSFKVIECYQDENGAINACGQLNRSHPNPKVSFFYENVTFVSYSHTLGSSTND